ncbi:hypothetical protein Cni_G06056 [Canna indica]|uniref:Thioredoxin domain-containing protein n=1 Tax=Canna indica TaxID=4628 RepID=A0AAQ3JXU0_9LILI|nr:hypothetical protein Cni_G06056 [Canna indica]
MIHVSFAGPISGLPLPESRTMCEAFLGHVLSHPLDKYELVAPQDYLRHFKANAISHFSHLSRVSFFPNARMSIAYLAPPHPCLSCVPAPSRAPVASASSFLDARSSLPQELGDSKGLGALPTSSFSSVSVAGRGRGKYQSARTGNLAVCLSSNAPEAITASAWDVSVLQSDLPVVVEFWASWCGPCKMVKRVLDELAIEYAGRIKLYMLNTDYYPQVATFHGIDRVPTVLLFKNGEKIKSITGTLPKSVYVEAIEQLLLQ